MSFVLTRELKCPYCDKTFQSAEDLEAHLIENHFLDLQAYYEMQMFSEGEEENNKYPLSYINTDYYLPEWSQFKRKYEIKNALELNRLAINEYYNNVMGDRFLQMFLITDVYFKSTLGHTYEDFKNTLKLLPKKDRNKIWFLDWLPGFPKIISPRNIDGIKVVPIDNAYDVKSEKDKIQINSWEIRYPEIVSYDKRHHSRYNIFNISGNRIRETKRLRLGNGGACIKFSNNPNSQAKTLFPIYFKDSDTRVYSLSEQDLTVTKLVLLRNKTFMKLICSMVDDLCKNINTLSDSIFLRNTVEVNPEKTLLLNISWLPQGIRENFDINISIL